MASTPIQSSNPTDLTGNTESRQRTALQNRIGKSQPAHSMLFDSLFTSKFFESTLVLPPPSMPVSEQHVAPKSEIRSDRSADSTEDANSKGEINSSSESEDKDNSENLAGVMVVSYQPNSEVYVDDTAKEVEPVCVVKCESPIQQSAENSTSLDLESNQIQTDEAPTGPMAISNQSEFVSGVGVDASTSVEIEQAKVAGYIEKESNAGKWTARENDQSSEEVRREGEIQPTFGYQESQQTPLEQIETHEDKSSSVRIEQMSSNEPQTQDFSVQTNMVSGQTSQQSSQGRRAERLAEKRFNVDSARRDSEDLVAANNASSDAVLDSESLPNEVATSQTVQSVSEPTQAGSLSELGSQPQSTLSGLSGIHSPQSNPEVSSAKMKTSSRSDVLAAGGISSVARGGDATLGQNSPIAPSFNSGTGLPNKLPGKTTAPESNGGYQGAESTKESETLTAYQQSRLLQRVLKGLERFSDGSSNVRLRLHPPELGALEMSLRMNQQQLSATITVESESVRQVLQENVQQLQTKLTEQGITVDKIDFKVQITQDTERSGSLAQQFSDSNGQAGTNSESGQGREFGQARANWLRNDPGVEATTTLFDSASLAAVRWNGSGNINIRA